ncbi:hypothetical protein G7Y41_02415 [Schaalia sp. ZJ405]|uniref:lipopolysaccharide biosynthesis protein n=1 Tax=Schaalia sp. ZJ405 TaxID=2709403 RepID=UPI0013E9A96A|nr:hypothetical protein [Schaalia sp. ZJ405]QPK81710.1 hypothetical protein G7Y41_02415 [Schaalia sp. ZJ405]
MKQIGIIGIALGLASALGIVFLGLTARWLTPNDNAAFITLWGVIFAGGSVFSSIEQHAARRISFAHENVTHEGHEIFHFIAIFAVGTALVLVPLGFFGWHTIFLRDSLLLTLVAIAYFGFIIQFALRGTLLGFQRECHYAAVILIEALARLVILVICVVIGVNANLHLAVCATVIGSFAWVPFAGIIRRFTSQPAPALPSTSDPSPRGDEPPHPMSLLPTSLIETIRNALVLTGANGLLACVLTGYPAVVSATIGSSMGLAVLFSVITISRVPLVLMSPIQALVIPYTSRAIREGRRTDLSRQQVTLGLGIAGALVPTALLGWLIGPWLITLVFGPHYAAPAWLVSLLLSATVVLAGALLLASTLVSLGNYAHVMLTWATTLLLTVVSIQFFPARPEIRGAVGFVVASVVAFVVSMLLVRSGLRIGKLADQ